MMTLAMLAVPVSDAALALRDIAQYVANVAAVGAFVFAWRTNTEMTRLKTVLLEPKVGAVDRIEVHGETIVTHGTMLAEHETRLEGHDREFREIKRSEANYPAPRHQERTR